MTKRMLQVALAFFATTVFCGLLASGPAWAQAQSKLDTVPNSKTLKVGWAVFHPYIYRDPKTNQVTGFSIDLANEMAKGLGDNVKVELVEDSWSTFAAGLQANKFDVFPGAAISLRRALAVSFSEPYTKQIYSLLASSEAASKAKSWKDFDRPGQKIVTILGSTTDTYLANLIKQAEVVRVRTVPDGLMHLVSGRVNAYASTTDSLVSLRKEHPNLAIVPGGFATTGFAIALPRNDPQWTAWVNEFVREMKRTGRITQLLEKYGMDHSAAAD
jgi:ABC-type amino acid transport substrate-binding protein